MWHFLAHYRKVLSLLFKIVIDANFPQDEISLVKTELLSKIEAALQEPDGVLRAGHQYILYNQKRIGKIGSSSAIKKITRENISQYFEKVRSCSVLYITAISDLSFEQIQKEVIEFTNSRKTNGFVLKDEVGFVSTKKPTVYIFDSPQSTNDRLIWSHEGIVINDERRFAMNLILDALGSFEGFLLINSEIKKDGAMVLILIQCLEQNIPEELLITPIQVLKLQKI